LITPSRDDDIVMAIPSIEGGELLARMLPTLRFKPANVIVLDQGSADRTAEICREAGVQLMQLGRPHTYTQACNIGARIARERGFRYLCVANNDITFQTDVLNELAAELDRDAKLGIVAPSQMIIDERSGAEILARRVFWNLDTVEFLHDCAGDPFLPRRLEADLCELTCALIRMSAVKQVGFLDDAYGFYHEDADFCFRLRKAGYGCAYLPRSQINHYSSSTFSNRRQEQLDYMARNRAYFARKHLGLGVQHKDEGTTLPADKAVLDRRLNPALRRFGLLDAARPELIVGGVGAATSDYVLTTQRAGPLPARWLAKRDQYRAVMAPSQRMATTLREAGFAAFHTPLGIDPDTFNRWGPVRRLFDETTFLTMLAQTDAAALATLRAAWDRARPDGARLVIVGSRLNGRMGRPPDSCYRSGGFDIFRYSAERIDIYDHAAPVADEILAQLYRSVDFTIATSPVSSVFGELESLACGTPCIVDAAGPSPERDLDCDDPAARWTAESLAAGIERASRLSHTERIAIAVAGEDHILGNATLRHTAMAIRGVLDATQQRDPAPVIARIAGAAAEAAPPVAAPSGEITPPVLRASLRVRASSAAARGVTRLGSLASGFGVAWQQRGLGAALSATKARVGSALVSRADPVPVPTPAAPAMAAKPPAPELARAPFGSTLLIGYIDAQLGIGESHRGLAIALQTAGVPFSIYPIGVGVEGRRTVPFMLDRYDEATIHAVNVIEVSPAELPRVRDHIGSEHFAGSYNILRTYWELARGPAVWRPILNGIDEIWSPNQFCSDAFRDFFDGPITIVPPCIEIGGPAEEQRARFGLAPGTFNFMFSFDYHSFPERKNPVAVVRAFLQAFPDISRPVGLVVKATGVAGHFPAVRKEIRALAASDDRIRILDESLSREEMWSLMASVDCCVSLHRSEGFGLVMADAMLLGKPVIATNYSGNTEFVTEETGYPIDYVLKKVGPDDYVHTGGQVWADPDEDACADAMRRVVDNPAEAGRKAEAGRRFVLERYGAANVGRLAAQRLAEILASGKVPPWPETDDRAAAL
jgi:GT2 family glycosyltransferase/glycosyltransferase involved in cell wall biosynthesis